MKRIILPLLLLPGILLSTHAQNLPFGNECLNYTIRHNLLPGNLGTMSFQGEEGEEGYHVNATLSAAIGSIYSLNCTYGSTFRKDADLTPISAYRSQNEKKYWAKGNYNWSAPGMVHLDVTKSTRPPRDETLTWPGTVRDLLGMIWWLRAQDYDQEPACSGNALLLDHDALPVTISTCARKTIRHNGTRTPVIEVTLSREGKEALSLTLTDDIRRIPLKFSIGLPFGTIKGTLRDEN